MRINTLAITTFTPTSIKWNTTSGHDTFIQTNDQRGQRFTGKAQVREALAGRFKGIPDVHYGEGRHWISENGNFGVSEWTLTGTTTSGVSIKVRG